MKSLAPVGFGHVVPIVTERLLLRPFRTSDGAALYSLHSDPDVTRYAGGLKNRTESDAILRRLIDRLERSGFGLLAVEEQRSGSVIGWCGLQEMRYLNGYEVIYALQCDRWGRGLAFEAARAVLKEAFTLNEVLLHEVFGLVFPENLRSIRVLKKLGMIYSKSILDRDTNKQASLYRVERNSFVGQVSSSK